MKSQRSLTLIILLVALLGLGWLIYDIGPAALLAQLLGVLWVFPWVLLAEGLSNASSTVGWLHAFPADSRPSTGRLMAVSFASLSVAGLLPSGQASELTKWNLLRDRVPTADVVASLVVFNYLHVATTLGAVLIGPLLALSAGIFPARASWIVLGVAVVCFAGALFAGWLLTRGLLARALRGLGRLPGLARLPSEARLHWAAHIDAQLAQILQRGGQLYRAAGWLALGRLFAIAEVAVILYALGLPDPILVALMVFSVTAVVNYVLLVLPAREGVLEASTYGVFVFLGLPGALGLSLEIVRRLRKISYQIFGVILLIALHRHGKIAPAPPEVTGE